ncbi:neutral zinc metallopeptidase [Cryptosporangium phraense]|uniref:Metalloprotease n=1 Tax=Cryptosporangium phraense TaxID=2593070 RepID=A0A545AXA3_9ACTN|nr:neutral zinc metallopeptidase [Cryptosporangium phraense]TQS45954.1 hypothetical protein FL583_05525 [Cryptosporangium phraense]
MHVLSRSIRVLVASVGVAALVALTGCGPLDSTASKPTSAQASKPAAVAGDPSASPAGDSDAVVQNILDSVVAYWTEQFQSSGYTFKPADKVITYTKAGEASCSGTPLEAGNAFYCFGDNTIIYDAKWVQQYRDKIGDGFLYFLFSHEYGHSVQGQVGANMLLSITLELQADCLSGAYLGDSVRAGSIRLTDADVVSLKKSLMEVGDAPTDNAYGAWFGPLAHGTMEKRLAAFTRGYDSSYGACHLDSNKGVVLKSPKQV